MIRWLAVFSPNGKYLLTCNGERVARLYNLQSKSYVHEFVGKDMAITSAAFSPDGSRILTGGSNATAELWDAENGALLAAKSFQVSPADAPRYP
jgi:WD40 repeat protein